VYHPRFNVYSRWTSLSSSPSLTSTCEILALTLSGYDFLAPILFLKVGIYLAKEVVSNLMSVTLKRALSLSSFKFICPILDLATSLRRQVAPASEITN